MSIDQRDHPLPGGSPIIRRVRPRRLPVFACGKCLKRLPEGRNLRRALKDALAARSGEVARLRLVKCACLGLCPKRAVVLASATTLARGEVVLVRSRAEAEAAIDTLQSSRAGPAILP